MGYDITDVSRLTQIPRSTLSKILNDHKSPDLSHARVMAAALKLNLTDITGLAEAEEVEVHRKSLDTGRPFAARS
ncbi:helix-turn-helix transcriptional regulator [Arthrobacter sp. NicSoilB8]|uniref:helix-turn-helix domain-containing protein n=1 Tax=Arthrobacter sp. NicSoilB8 TaxID=2830998 RepID=UPI001E7BBA8D|nr:helix-turn-helix transcriptional regulator [Arthrobacter sp. NicSoilB8]BCW71863.1 hypothetical protein NicSoilB8_29070 [Arthrobacter sp. NicSoilB8]